MKEHDSYMKQLEDDCNKKVDVDEQKKKDVVDSAEEVKVRVQ